LSSQSFWSKCGVSSIDHFAVTTIDIEATTKDYLSIPGTQLIRGPGYNKSQNVDYSFIRMGSGEVIEILGVKQNSPISKHVENGAGAYHICFIVRDIDYAIKAAKIEGAILVVEPREDDVFSPRKVCFMMHKNHGIFEFLEATSNDLNNDKKLIEINDKNNFSVDIDGSINPKEIAKKAFTKVFNLTEDYLILKDLSYGDFEKWDSLNHLILIMEVESLSGISFTAKEIAEVKSFSDLENLLTQKI
jgi:acyl carrier protein